VLDRLLDIDHSLSSLVICPNHVPKQWEEEIQKVTSKEVKVLYVTTKPQHDKVTYESIMTAGITFDLLPLTLPAIFIS